MGNGTPFQGGIAPPISELKKIPVTTEPAGGQGFSLNLQGHIPVVAIDGRMTMEIHTQAVNLGNHVADAGGTVQVTIPGLRVGDFVAFVGTENTTAAMRGFIFSTSPVCATEGEISFHSFNASGAAADLPSRNFSFLVIHRHL